ncbi:MAG TPA: glutamine-synthetase adenylyltransferase, partial [Lysobacter sp.]
MTASSSEPFPPALEALATRALPRLGLGDADGAAHEPLPRSLAIASEFAIDTLARQPGLLAALAADAPLEPPRLTPDNRGDWAMLLRRYRAAESTRLIWRDLAGLDDVEATLAGSTALAETCLRVALDALEAEFVQRHGVVRDTAGAPQRLVVFGLGKLGGGELNFSSDVDLVYAYEHDGESDVGGHPGARALDAGAYFTRLGQQLAKLLDETTADGFCHRVDLRLRPYGNAGR